MASERMEIAGSQRAPLADQRVGAVDPAETATISIYLKAPASSSGVVGRESLRAQRETDLAPAFARLKAFAEAHGLTLVETDPARRLARISGSLSQLSAAFQADLGMYDLGDGSIRARAGVLTAPADIAPDIEAVLGLDQRPAATPKSRILPNAAAANASYEPNKVAALYGFPTSASGGAGECIALIELGGGVSAADTQSAFNAMGLKIPQVVSVSVDGASTTAGQDTNADGEVALDIQVAGGAAPGARIAVYFAPNTDQGFVDAITPAVHDMANAPSVMSISWGSAESQWTGQAISAMQSAFQDAASAGVSVFAASGDGLATDGQSDGKAHVDFPASSPLVVGCGGTALHATGGRLTSESAWNSNGGGTGGGVSSLFPKPSYQSAINVPAPPVSAGGRGVPDVAADADPSTGYKVVVDGKSEVIGGTSAAAPLWAGLFALVNAAAGRPAGDPHAALYAKPTVFNDVTTGNNKSGSVGYNAGPGWDPCTGLGTPKGAAVVSAFQAAPEGS